MTYNIPHCLRIILNLIFFGFFLISARAQDNLRYEGPLTIGNYTGDATYGYVVSNGDTILNGPFRLKRANLDALLQKQDYSFDFSGRYVNDYPTGFWDFKFGEFKSNNESQVIDYQYRVAVSGIQEEASGNLVKGKPDGTWTYTVNRIEDSEVSQTLFKSSILFDKGVPQQSFRIENDSLTLAGRFLRNGLAHDEWSLFESTGLGAAESWFFDDGLLHKIQYELDGTLTTIPIYQDRPNRTQIVNLDTRYIKVLTIWQSLDQTSSTSIGGSMQYLLSENATYYKKIDDILSELGKSSFLPEFKVKVPFYPLTDNEERTLDSITQQFEKAKGASDSFLSDTQLNILKLSDEEAAYLYAVTDSISKNFLNPIARILEYREQEVLRHLPLGALIESLWPDGKPTTNIGVTITLDSITKEKNFEASNAKGFQFSKNDVASLGELMDYASICMDSIQQVLNKRLTNEKRQQELVAIEERLIAQQQQLKMFVDTANVSSNAERKALNQLKSLADAELTEYASLEGLEPKLKDARDLLDCFVVYGHLARSVAILPTNWKTIQEKYKDRIWNPFMATLMDEEVKKRITSAYRKVLVPYFLAKISPGLECDEVEPLNALMQDTYQRMLELRLENTAKLERKLRRTTDPETVLELFGLTSTLKTKE